MRPHEGIAGTTIGADDADDALAYTMRTLAAAPIGAWQLVDERDAAECADHTARAALAPTDERDGVALAVVHGRARTLAAMPVARASASQTIDEWPATPAGAVDARVARPARAAGALAAGVPERRAPTSEVRELRERIAALRAQVDLLSARWRIEERASSDARTVASRVRAVVDRASSVLDTHPRFVTTESARLGAFN